MPRASRRQPAVSATAHEAALFGRRDGSSDVDELFDEAEDFVEVVRTLWDSWEDDAVIRDAGLTGHEFVVGRLQLR
ncbi:putative coenzyme F420-dependent N5,N10-methylene tetrahydromethanopterin reductase [Mycobacterium xenopi 3993]|nr:putative coenzyme F420-dependent N5,N10-methylene tetrahydromethanopterin reductase [Mycobacterium xenopi 3993]